MVPCKFNFPGISLNKSRKTQNFKNILFLSLSETNFLSYYSSKVHTVKICLRKYYCFLNTHKLSTDIFKFQHENKTSRIEVRNDDIYLCHSMFVLHI